MNETKLDKRVEKNINSLKNLRTLLMNVIKDPEHYMNDSDLKEALVSQGKLAKYVNDDLNIYATSINTMKRLSNYSDCDFDALDKLRVASLEILSSNNTENKQTYNKQDLLLKIDNLEQSLNKSESSQLLLLKTLYEINQTFKIIKDLSNADEIKEHVDLLDKKMKKVISLDANFLVNMNSNIISYDFRKKD